MDKQELVECYLNEIRKCKTGNVEEDYFEYIVTIQDSRFKICVTDKELADAAEIALLLLEQVLLLPQNGISKSEFARIRDEVAQVEESPIEMLIAMKQIENDKIKDLICRAAEVMRVGGAYFMLLSGPILSNAFYIVSERLIDDLENEDLQIQSGYFLFRSILRMHSADVRD